VKVTASDQQVLRDRPDLAPVGLGGLGPAQQDAVEHRHQHQGEEHRAHLRHREADAGLGVDEVAVDAVEDHRAGGGGEDQELHRVDQLGPRDHRGLAAAAVEHEAQEGRQDEDVDGGVLGRHHAEVAEHRVRRTAHRLDLLGGGDDRPRRRPHREAQRDHHQHRPDVGAVALGALDALHAQPQVPVGEQEEVADQHRLDDEQPREGAAHHRQAHGLREGVDLRRQPVAGKRQRQKAHDGDEVAHVAHPVEVGALLVGLGGQELEGGIGGGHGAAEGDVGDDAVDVDRHPGVVGYRVPGAEHGARLGDPRRRHHEGQPGVGDEHDAGADHVEHQAEEEVDLGRELAPAVVVAVEEAGLGEEQQHVGQEGRREHRHQVVGELGVEDDQHEGQPRPQGGGERERGRQQLGELVGELVVALVAGAETDELDHQGEDRHRQHERREQQVELGDDPDRHPAADPRHRPVLGLHVGLLGVRRGLGLGALAQRPVARRLGGGVGLALDRRLVAQGAVEGGSGLEQEGGGDHRQHRRDAEDDRDVLLHEPPPCCS
jgi:hypothetical protein